MNRNTKHSTFFFFFLPGRGGVIQEAALLLQHVQLSRGEGPYRLVRIARYVQVWCIFDANRLEFGHFFQ